VVGEFITGEQRFALPGEQMLKKHAGRESQDREDFSCRLNDCCGRFRVHQFYYPLNGEFNQIRSVLKETCLRL